MKMPDEYTQYVKQSWINALEQYRRENIYFQEIREDCTLKVFNTNSNLLVFFVYLCYFAVAMAVGIFIWFVIADFALAILAWLLIPVGIVAVGIGGILFNYQKMTRCLEWMDQPQPKNPCESFIFPHAILPDYCPSIKQEQIQTESIAIAQKAINAWKP